MTRRSEDFPFPIGGAYGSAVGPTVLWIVGLLQVAYLVHFFSIEMPNHRVDRLVVWALVLGMVPEYSWPLGAALREALTSPYMIQRIYPSLWALVGLVSAVGMGYMLLRGLGLDDEDRHGIASGVPLVRLERFTWAYAFGMTAISMVTLLLGSVGLLNPWLFRALAAFSGGWALWNAARQGIRPRRPKESLSASGLLVAVLPALAITAMLLGALLPAVDFDCREYHLQGPKEYFLQGRISFLPHNVYTNLPFGTEMVTLYAMMLVGDWWWGALSGQLLLATFPLMTGCLAWCLASRCFGTAAGPWAAFAVWTTPWFYRIGIIPYAESGLCFYTLATVLALAARGPEGLPAAGSRRCLAASWFRVGWMAGAAFGCKYTALPMVVVPSFGLSLGQAFLRRNTSRAEPGKVLASFILGLAVTAGPWLLKNTFLTGNPVYPLAYELFGGFNWTPEKDAKWDRGHQPPPYSLKSLWTNALDVVVKSDWQNGLLLAFAPVSLLGCHRRKGVLLWGYVLYLFACWWWLTHRIDRFWLPLEGILCVLAGGGLSVPVHRWGWKLWCMVTATIVSYYNVSIMVTSLCGNNAYGCRIDELRRDPLSNATGQFVRYANEHLPHEAVILSVGAADLFHLNRALFYHTVFDDCLLEQWTRSRPPVEAGQALAERGVSHVFVCWEEINRYRKTYGFTDYVTPALFELYRRVGILVVRRTFGGWTEVDGQLLPAGVLYEVMVPRVTQAPGDVASRAPEQGMAGSSETERRLLEQADTRSLTGPMATHHHRAKAKTNSGQPLYGTAKDGAYGQQKRFSGWNRTFRIGPAAGVRTVPRWLGPRPRGIIECQLTSSHSRCADLVQHEPGGMGARAGSSPPQSNLGTPVWASRWAPA